MYAMMMVMILVYNNKKLSLQYYIFLLNKYNNIMQWFPEEEDVLKNVDKLCNDLKGQIFLYLPIKSRISLLQID